MKEVSFEIQILFINPCSDLLAQVSVMEMIKSIFEVYNPLITYIRLAFFQMRT